MNSNRKKTVLVAMSGGVDSSVAAFLLKKQGYNIIGAYMRLSEKDDSAESAARKVCQKLDIRFYPTNVSQSFEKEVIDYFIDNYAAGLTPNPCVRCNKVIKFGALLKMMAVMKGDYLATGHYIQKAKGKNPNDKYLILRGVDNTKDQSYFLYTLGQAQLQHLLFPLGEYKKIDVRKIADKAGLPCLKKESQDVCFLTNEGKILDHNEFLKAKIKLKPGDIKTLDNKTVGQHQGLPLYTIGQRRGVEIGGTGPYYVVKADYKTNTLYVVADRDDKALYKQEFKIKEVNWVSGKEPKMPFACAVVIRYRHKAMKCNVESLGGLKRCQVVLEKPERAVTPGQSAVLYLGDEVIGGGIII